MRTVREMARLLGWPEARQQPPTVTVWRGDTPLRVPARTLPRPKLRVRKAETGDRWLWEVWEGCRFHSAGFGLSWAIALHVGLANLEAASVGVANRPR